MVESVVDVSNCERAIFRVSDQAAMPVPATQLQVSLYTSFRNQVLICYFVLKMDVRM
jgi:hypothetical protein